MFTYRLRNSIPIHDLRTPFGGQRRNHPTHGLTSMNKNKPAPTWKSIALWFVSDGQDDRFVAFDRAAAQVFADVANRHCVASDERRFRVERRNAHIEPKTRRR